MLYQLKLAQPGASARRRASATTSASLDLELLEEFAQIQRRSCPSVAHRRHRTIVHTVDRPTDDRRSICAGRAGVTLLSARTGLAAAAAAAFAAEELPAIARADAGIIAPGDVAGAFIYDDIKPLVLFIRVICAAHIRRSPITAVAAGACDTHPIWATGGLCSVLARLPERTVVANDFALVDDTLLAPNLRNRQLARHRQKALFLLRELRLECALH